MADFSMNADGIIELSLDLGNAAYYAQPEIRQVLGAYAQKIRTDAINSMRRGSPTGRTAMMRLKGRKKGFSHTASAPGQPPAVITGRLMNSITVDAHSTALAMEVGPTVNYGRYLEEGTERMAARPYLAPALEKNLPGLEASLARVISARLRT